MSELVSRQQRRAVGLVAVVQFFVTLEVSMLFPMGPALSQALHFPMEQLGYLNGSFLAAAFVSGMLGAIFLDRFERRLALGLSLLGLTMGTLAAGLAVDLHSLLACRVAAGLFGGPTAALSLAMVADLVAVGERGRALGVVARGSAVAIVLGVPMAMQVNDWGGWRWTFHAAGALGLVLTLLTLVGLPRRPMSQAQPSRSAPQLLAELRAILSRPATLMAIGCTATISASMTMMAANLAPFLVFNLHFPQKNLKYLWMVGGLFMLLGSQVSGRLVDRFGAVKVLWVASAAAALDFAVLFVAAPTWAPVMVLFCGYSITTSARLVAMNSLISMTPAPEERGRFMSLVTAGNQLLAAAAVSLTALVVHTTRTGSLANMGYVGWIAVAVALAVPGMARRLRASTVAH